MNKLPTVAEIVSVLAHDGQFVVFYNDLNEDFTRAIAFIGDHMELWNSDITENEVAEIQFEDGVVTIFLL